MSHPKTLSTVRPLQPYFRCFLVLPDGTDFEITNYVTRCTYTEQADLLTVCNIYFREAEIVLMAIRLGLQQRIKFYGGDLSSGNSNYRKVFDGTVRRIVSLFSESGTVALMAECISGVATRAGVAAYSFTYPSVNCEREWGQPRDVDSRVKVLLQDSVLLNDREGITIETIVKNIIKEIDMAEGNIVVPYIVYTVESPIVQKNQSDWSFLRKLAEIADCVLWTEIEGDKEVVNFVSRESLLESPVRGEVEFYYPLRQPERAGLKIQQKGFRYSTEKYNWVQMRNVSVSEDAGQIGAWKTMMTSDEGEDNGVETRMIIQLPAIYQTVNGEEVAVKEEDIERDEFGNVVSVLGREYKEQLKKDLGLFEQEMYYTYVLDKEAVEALSVDEQNKLRRALTGRAVSEFVLGNFIVSNKGFRKFFILTGAPMKPEVAISRDRYIGVKVSAEVDLNVYIYSQRNYMLHGILRYSDGYEGKIFRLISLTHEWGESEAPKTTLEFMR